MYGGQPEAMELDGVDCALCMSCRPTESEEASRYPNDDNDEEVDDDASPPSGRMFERFIHPTSPSQKASRSSPNSRRITMSSPSMYMSWSGPSAMQSVKLECEC